MNRICLILLVLQVTSCSTRSTINIRSLPQGATVSVIETDGTIKEIGKTPLDTNEQYVSLQVDKEGYEPYRIFLGGIKTSGQEFTVKLASKAEDLKVGDIKNRHEKLAKGIARAHSLITRKKFTEAEALLINLTNDYPHVSVGYDLLGNISYLQKDLRRAVGFYEKSLQINPENLETKQVVDRIKSMSN